MGVFSWLDCKNNRKAIKIGCDATVYVLVPAEFGGGHIAQYSYGGYGDFAGYDIYELVADWNQNYITDELINSLESLKLPKIEQFWGGLYDWDIEKLLAEGKTPEEIEAIKDKNRAEAYNRNLRYTKRNIDRMKDFAAGTDEETMIARYGEEYKREIGIDLACYDEDNRRIKYAIKITFDEASTYEARKPSKSDPNQGCD